jgi:ferredoxin-NADP reductase
MHRIFAQGRRVFISRPINHFPLVEGATRTILMGGGIGVTPMIAMAHRLHALGRNFALHYAVKSRASAGYLADLAAVPWADRVVLHISDEGSRADLDAVLAGYRPGWHVYTCGPDRFMSAVVAAAQRQGFPDEARHLEYFSVPEAPDWVNHPFVLRLADGRELPVPADRTATDVLAENGIRVDVKCADGICGVCKCRLLSGEVEHRDWVLSKAQRETSIILCQSRAANPGGVVEIDLP